MMIRYGRKFTFAAPPRTGSTWFLKAAEYVGLGEANKTIVHEPFTPTRLLKVSMVRHPENWIVSCWTALQGGRIGVDSVDRLGYLNYEDGFRGFMDSYERFDRPFLTEIIKEYAADSYLRTEDLPWCFLELCDTAGYKMDPKKRVGILELNVQNPSKQKPVLSKYHRSVVRSLEHEIYDQFDYVGTC